MWGKTLEVNVPLSLSVLSLRGTQSVKLEHSLDEQDEEKNLQTAICRNNQKCITRDSNQPPRATRKTSYKWISFHTRIKTAKCVHITHPLNQNEMWLFALVWVIVPLSVIYFMCR